MTGHVLGGNLSNQYNSASAAESALATALNPFAPSHLSQVLMVQGGDQAVPVFNAVTGKSLGVTLPNQKNATFNRDSQGWTIRANLGFDFASNTAYGPLIGHFDINSDLGSGLDSPNGSFTYVNTGYVTWAGITAGKAQSFFSFIGGGDNWNNFFSPDRKGFNEPNLLAYTASFGGGFSATISAESNQKMGDNFESIAGGSNMPGINSTFGGQRWPDIVGALHVKQGLGEAHVAGVL